MLISALAAAAAVGVGAVAAEAGAAAAGAAAPPATPPPCHLNGERSAAGGPCVCDPGWTGTHCGQLDLLPAPALAQQVSPAAAQSDDNAAANA